jgi:hypothetical protein
VPVVKSECPQCNLAHHQVHVDRLRDEVGAFIQTSQQEHVLDRSIDPVDLLDRAGKELLVFGSS